MAQDHYEKYSHVLKDWMPNYCHMAIMLPLEAIVQISNFIISLTSL